MADLGNLWFSLGLDDSKFKKEWESAFKQYQKDAKINVDINISKRTIDSLKELKNINLTNKQWSAVAKAADAAAKYEKGLIQSQIQMEKLNQEQEKALKLQNQRLLAQEKLNQALLRSKNLQTQANTQQGVTSTQSPSQVTKEYKNQSLWLQNLKTTAANYLSLFAAKDFVTNLARISGEFEIQRKTLQAMIGEFEGSQLYSQIKELSVVSPFQFKDLASYTKQLAAFSVPYNELYDTTKSLADISAGLGVDMSRIVLAFGQIRSSQVLKGTELRQLTEAGVHILEELANKFTQLEGRAVSVGEVFGKISQKLVPFEMVNDILKDMTSEGGKFYNMQEIQADTLAGKISNLTDAYQIMLSELGEDNEGALKKSVEWLYRLIDNYEVLIGVLKTVGLAYTAYQGVQLLAFGTSVLKQAGAFTTIIWRLHGNLIKAAKAMQALNIATKTTFWGVLFSVITAVGVGIYQVTQNAKRFNEEMNKMLGADLSKLRDEQYALEKLKKATEDAAIGSLNRKDAIDKINSRYGEYLTNMLTEKSTAEEVAAAYDRITIAMRNKYKQESLEKAKSKVNEEYGDDIDKYIKNIDKYLLERGYTDKESFDVTTLLRQYLESGKFDKKEIQKIFSDRIGFALDPFENNSLINFDIFNLRDSIKEYQKALSQVERNVNLRYGTNTYNTRKEADFIEALNAKYAELEEQIRSTAKTINGEIIPAEQRQGELVALEIKKLQELSEAYADPHFLNNPARAKEVEKQWQSMIQQTTEWEKVIRTITKDNLSAFEFNPLKNEQLPDYLKRLQERYEDLLSTKKLLETKVNKGENIVGSKQDLDMVEEKLKEIKLVASSINFNLIDKDGEKDRKSLLKLDELLQNYKNKLNQFYADIELKASELEIQMSDLSMDNIGQGDFAQKLNKINQEFDKGQLSIEKYKNKLIKAWREIEEARAKAEGRVFKGDVTLEMLPKQAQDAIRAYEAVIAKKKEFDTAMLSQSVVDEFATLNKKRQDVIDEYLSKLSSVTSTDFKHLNIDPLKLFFPNGIPYDRILEELSKIDLSKVEFKEGFDVSSWFSGLSKELWNIDKDLNPIYEQIFGNLQTMTRTQILAAIRVAKETLKNADLTDVQQSEIREQIDKLREAYDKMDTPAKATLDISAFIDQIKNYKALKKQAKELNDEESKRAEKMAKEQVITSGLAIGAMEIAKGLNLAADSMRTIADASGDVHLTEVAEQMSAVAQTLSAAAQGAASGDWIGAVIGGATDLVGQIVNAGVQADASRAKLHLFFQEFRREMELLKYSIDEDDYETIFGVNSISKVQEAINNASDALRAYNRELTESQLKSMRVKTINRAGIANFFGKKDSYQRLEQFAPELWVDGQFNVEAAEKFLEINEQLTTAQKEQIQAAIDLFNIYKENTEVIDEYLRDIFSDTASTITDQMMNAFAQTGNAAFELGDIVSNVANKMAKDLIQALLIDEYLQPTMDKVRSLYDKDSKDYEDNAYMRTQKAIQAMQAGLAAAQEAVPEVNALLQALEAAGVEIKGDSESASQVLSGLTEDQQNLLVSYINGIRADVSINKGIMTTIANYAGTINNNIATALIVWKQIEANTHRSADGVDRLVDIFESVIGVYDGGSGQAFRVNVS
jgi:hypothetical protein